MDKTSIVLKRDKLGRVRTPVERREALVAEFRRSGLSGMRFTELVGVRYNTFWSWLHAGVSGAKRGRRVLSRWLSGDRPRTKVCHPRHCRLRCRLGRRCRWCIASKCIKATPGEATDASPLRAAGHTHAASLMKPRRAAHSPPAPSSNSSAMALGRTRTFDRSSSMIAS